MEPLPLVPMKLAPSDGKGQGGRRFSLTFPQLTRAATQSNLFDSSSTLTASTPFSTMGALPLVQGLLLRPHFSEPQGGTSTCFPDGDACAGGCGPLPGRPPHFRSPCSARARPPLRRRHFSAASTTRPTTGAPVSPRT